jgi:hypothetical protein
MNEREARTDGDRIRGLVFKRTGLRGEQLQCPREGSEMTPCVARDGGLAVCQVNGGIWACVGCEHSLEAMLRDEKAKHGTPRASQLW